MSTNTSLITTDGLSWDYLPAPDPKAVEQAMLIGDLSQMTDEQRIAYYVAICRSLHLNPLTKPFMALKDDDGKLKLYPDKGCAEQLRKRDRISTKILGREMFDGLYIVTALARTPDGREEEAQGIVPLVKPKGRWEEYEYRGQSRRRFKPDIGPDGQEVFVSLSPAERAAAMKRAETQAKRRATLAICGLGMPEWEAEPTSPSHPQDLALHQRPEEAAKDLSDHIADVFGAPSDPTAPAPRVTVPIEASPAELLARVQAQSDPTTPSAGAAGLEYTPQIEAAILANQGDIERWYVWAERRFGKRRALFSVEDYAIFLDAVRAAASMRERPHKPLQDAQEGEEATEGGAGQETSQNVPTGQTGASEPHLAGPDLFKLEEESGEFYGE